MKRCIRCHVEKPIESFLPVSGRPGKRYGSCRECHFKGLEVWKLKNPGHKKRENDKMRYTRRDLLLKFFSTNPCVDCGETDPVVLEFDHIKEKGKKEFNIGDLIRRVNIDKLVAEMQKCEVRCCNCHRRMTAARNPNHWIHRYNRLLPNATGRQMAIVLAGSQGVEPRPGEPKPPVLPLHHEPIKRGRTPGLQLLLI